MDQQGDGAHRARPHRGTGNPHRSLRCFFHRSDFLTVRHRDVDDGEAGWTFVEILIVIAIILILTSAVGFMSFRYIDKARVVTAKSQIESMSLALNAYALDCRQYPTKEQGLDALWEKPTIEPVPAGWNGPYVTKKITEDPWGHAWELAIPGPNGLPFGLRSFGADGKEGGEGNDKDVSSWAD